MDSATLVDESRPCSSCSSGRQMELLGDICLHFPRGLEDLRKPHVWIFPKVLVCLDCGEARFMVSKAELNLFTTQKKTSSLT